MDFRTLSDEELRTFLRAGTACFDNKKLAEQEALKRYIRYAGPDADEDVEEAYERGHKIGWQGGYADGLRDSREENKELTFLRADQVLAVMPLIGPLLDAWENVHNEEKFSIRDGGLGKYLDAIEAAMENAPSIVSCEPVDLHNDKVICPNCVHQFRAIPLDVQALLSSASYARGFIDGEE